MESQDARQLLLDGVGDEFPVVLPASVLGSLVRNDIPEGVQIEIGRPIDGVTHLDWNGRLWREGDDIVGEADFTWTRKYWYAPLGLEQYMDLVRRAVETRHRLRGDVELTHFEDDGAYIQLLFVTRSTHPNVGRAFEQVQQVAQEVEEAAENASLEAGQRVAEIAARLSGWGADSLERLIEQVESSKSSDDKGRSLEELCSRLFEAVPGFSVSGRIRTATEEIDITIVNDSAEPRLRREGAVILAECKNWTGKCGKNEFVLFKEKIENRSRRCSLGFLVSWNGFAETVTKEMLRGSKEETLVVPVTGEDIRHAVRTDSFLEVLLRCWDRAVAL